ncbi:MAG: serine/threonine protein kinase [Kofleriaceae bacterium]|nr:serine/threonine protein kinase [Kofleriaceae bacterium]MCL4227546.1 serine/threonine protein kinase [Myxococcales bacterium]
MGHDLETTVLLAGKYALGDCIGAGGMGRVYRAEQVTLCRTVAVKVMHRELADDDRIARHFKTEAIAAARFAHPNSVAVIDYGETEDGAPFLVMEYVQGRSLASLVRNEAPLDPARGTGLVIQLLDALADAHTLGIVHADVKSDNVLVETTRDRGEQAKLVDFGLARISAEARDPGDTFDGTVISGTPEYMAPEVIQGAAPTAASDLYAAGALLYELLTGSTPFAGASAFAETLRRHIEDVVVPPSLRCPELAIPRHIEQAVMTALAKDPARRFPSAAAFIAALEAGPAVMAASRGPRRCTVPRPMSTDHVTTLVLGPRDEQLEGPRRVARGSGQHATAEIELRREIGLAILAGDPELVVTRYLALAELLRALGRPRSAATELEEAIDLLCVGASAGTCAFNALSARVLAALIPLYVELGDHEGARRAARGLEGQNTMTMPR